MAFVTSTFEVVMDDFSIRTVTCAIDPDRSTSHRVMGELQAYSEGLFGDRLRVRSFLLLRQNVRGR